MAATLSIANFVTASNYAITDSGTPIDWALYNAGSGASTTLPPGQRMSGGGSTISDIARIVSGNIAGFTVYLADASWTGGTPTASGNNTNACYNDTNGGGGTASGQGASFTCPATTSRRRVRIYCGTFNGDITCTATLSDSSAGPVNNTSLSDPSGTTGVFGYFDITYEASSSTTLTVQFIVSGGRAFSDIEIQGIAIFPVASTITLVGQAMTVAQGSMGIYKALALSGQSAAFVQGTLTPRLVVQPTGLGMTAAQGSLVPAKRIGLTGQSLSLAQGTLGIQQTLTLAGQSLTLTAGNLSKAMSVALSGQTLTFGQGNVTIPGDVSVGLSGSQVVVLAGNLSPRLSLALSGQPMTLSGGTLSARIAQALTGQAMSFGTGTLVPVNQTAVTARLDGQGMRMFQGQLVPRGGTGAGSTALRRWAQQVYTQYFAERDAKKLRDLEEQSKQIADALIDRAIKPKVALKRTVAPLTGEPTVPIWEAFPWMIPASARKPFNAQSSQIQANLGIVQRPGELLVDDEDEDLLLAALF